MEINEYGQVIVSESEAFDALYSGKLLDLGTIFLDNPAICTLFNESVRKNYDKTGFVQFCVKPTISISDFDRANQQQWFMPADYCPNLVEMLYSMCTTKEQQDRVSLELELFIQHGMYDLLHYLKYLVDTLREKNVLWGVGRGSSVSSYILFLIGVHKVDSIRYNLDIHEFLK